MCNYFVAIFLMLGINETLSDSIKISVFYECLCSDSISFIEYQLFPTYKNIGNDIQLDLIPFGNAEFSNKSGKLEFECQHGARECYGNMIESCAIQLYSVEESMEFIYCALKSEDPSADYFMEQLGVKVGVYYEALCPDSVRFIVQQLYPHYSEIAKYVDLELVPYGKAAHSKANGTWQFLCQHGPSECRGNKYQACALSQNSSSEANVDFVNCVMRSRSRSELSTVEYCAGRYNMDVGRLRSCSTSTEADTLLAANGDKTPSIAFVPSIIYDDSFDQTAQDQSLEDFVAVVCSKISEKPSICENRTLPAVHVWTLF